MSAAALTFEIIVQSVKLSTMIRHKQTIVNSKLDIIYIIRKENKQAKDFSLLFKYNKKY